jgi:hypothetical protein
MSDPATAALQAVVDMCVAGNDALAASKQLALACLERIAGVPGVAEANPAVARAQTAMLAAFHVVMRHGAAVRRVYDNVVLDPEVQADRPWLPRDRGGHLPVSPARLRAGARLMRRTPAALREVFHVASDAYPDLVTFFQAAEEVLVAVQFPRSRRSRRSFHRSDVLRQWVHALRAALDAALPHLEHADRVIGAAADEMEAVADRLERWVLRVSVVVGVVAVALLCLYVSRRLRQ